MTIFKTGDFLLHSGERSHFKIDCDGLTDEDIQTLALMIFKRAKPFGLVFGVPTGGTRLASALHKYSTYGPRLIVDDVLTTGSSILEEMDKYRHTNVKGFVIFARGPLPEGVDALFDFRGE